MVTLALLPMTGKETQVKVTISPANASNKSLVWSIEYNNGSVVPNPSEVVRFGEDGKFTMLKAGDYKIKAKSAGAQLLKLAYTS